MYQLDRALALNSTWLTIAFKLNSLLYHQHNVGAYLEPYQTPMPDFS